MVPDIDIKHYYAKFIEESNKEYIANKEEYDILTKTKSRLCKALAPKLDIINEFFELNLNAIDDSDDVLKVNYDYIKTKTNTSKFIQSAPERKITVLSFIKYIQTIKLIYALNRNIELIKARKSISLQDYKKLVFKFYNYGVCKCILDGHGYKIAGGLGTILCNRWKVTSPKKLIDFNATNKRKKEIIAAGLEPYDKQKAEICKLRGIKYNGVDYKVYKTNEYYYEFKMIDNSKIRNVNIKFERKERPLKGFAGKSYEDVAKEMKSVDDILNLKTDIRYKLMIMLNFEPMSYLNFIRNAEQKEYNVGAHNSKNRQRL